MEISNKLLAFLVVFAIGLSAVSTITLMNRISMIQPVRQVITGRATPHLGNVTVTVQSAVSIILDVDTIDFGTGFVNTTPTACKRNATMTAGRYYVDRDDCWTAVGSIPPSPGGFNITNDGNQNVTVCVRGPHEDAFFTTGGAAYTGYGLYLDAYNLTWASINITGCAVGLQTANVSFGGANDTVCQDFRWEDANDRLGVDVTVEIPSDLNPGVYENASIDFTAFQSHGQSDCVG